ncbi:aminotransferase [Aestuariibius insulae]|uniref:aminotransferase n=1 Tax=Aestuariibius insulae TaxID=2058287 RepID=UPI00345E5D5E
MSRTTATFPPPVMEARRWLENLPPTDRPLLNVSQAAPTEAPPEPLLNAMAEIVLTVPEAHLYGPVLGLPELRAQIAEDWSAAYQGVIGEDQVAITAGCNQAYAAAIATLCSEGDEVLLPIPYYFNHRMWNDMAGVRTVPLPASPDLLPDLDAARRQITDRTKAIVLVTPNNPTGREYPAPLVGAFATLARERGLALIVDETYRDFDSREGAPHDLFADPNWDDTVIQLYSFSKAYRLTGHRTGALIASPARLAEVEKFLDTVAICPPQIGQRAALWGMRHLQDWLAGERLEILDRRAALTEAGPAMQKAGWTLKSCGAYFAYLEHPFPEPSSALAKRLPRDAGILALPGTMFAPDGDADAARHLRIAFANIDRAEIEDLTDRLIALGGQPS